ncbi:MAG: glycosyltransferase family 2 protein [Pseudomonadota bacterium]
MTGPHVAIGVCTFRRPMVAETLRSLFAQNLPDGMTIRIIVSDNDDTASAKAAVSAMNGPIAVTYLHAPARNISVARNAALEAAVADGAAWFAFADDDERLEPDWLSALWRTAQATGAGVVLGDVRAHYGPAAPDWMRRGSVHDTRPERDAAGQVMGGYTGNVLIKVGDPRLVKLRFDPARGRTGGEDTVYFAEARARGVRFAHAPDAVAHEDVPEDRATLAWLLRRRMRMGQTHASLIGTGAGLLRRLALATVALAKLGACGVMAMARLPDPLARNRAIMRGALHFGTASGLLSARSLVLYGTQAAATVREPAQ